MLTNETALSKIQFRERSLEITRQLGRLDLDHLKDEIEEVGAESIWWGVLAAQAQGDAERAKLRVDVVKAQVGRATRQDFTTRSEKITEDKVEETIKLSPEYQQVMAEQIEAFEKAGTLNAVRFAVDRKQKTLEGLGHLLVAELNATNGRPTVRGVMSPEDKLRERMRDEMAGAVLIPRGRGRPPKDKPVAPAAPVPVAPVAPRRRQAAE